MSAEKIEKLKKGLTNSQIPETLKQKIREQIIRLEAEMKSDEGMTATEVKKEVTKIEKKVDDSVEVVEKKIEQEKEKMEEKVEVKKTTTRKPRTTRTVAKKPTTRKPSQTSKPKPTAMTLAKEIRKEGESWNDARARASKMMKEKTKSTSKDVESELDKLIKLVRGEKNKQKVSGISGTNLRRDASRKAKPRGARRVTHSGETSNQYGTFSNKLGRKYYESRDRHSDRLAPRYPKNSPYLADGGYLTDPTFGNFQNTMFAEGGAIKNQYANRTPEDIWNKLSVEQRKHFLLDHISGDEEIEQIKYRYAGEDNREFVDEYSNKEWKKLSGDVKQAFREHVKLGQYADGGNIGNNTDVILSENSENKLTWRGIVTPNVLKDIEEFQYQGGFKRYEIDIYDENLSEKPNKENINKLNGFLNKIGISFGTVFVYAEDYAKGGGIRRKNGQTYDYGRVWTKDHNEFDKGADHEVNYRRKRFELGGTMATDLAGHTGGGDAGLNAGMPLDGFSNTSYTGLVGETGAMSSGEMFMAGGSVDSKFDLAGFKRVGMFDTLEEAKTFADIERKQNSNFDAVVIKDNVRTSQPFLVFSKLKKGKYIGNRVYEQGGGLPNGASQSYMITESLGNPAQHFDMGGELADNVEYMKDMMKSLYTYGGIERGSYGFNKYLLKYEDILGKKLFDKTYNEELKNLQEYEIEQNTSIDSDGLTYNSLKRKMAMGGDLFENYEEQPEELSEIVDYYMNKFDDGDYDYEDSQNFLSEVEAIGYTFDYGLDNEPYNLRLIETDMPNYTQMENNYANGGFMNDVYAGGGKVHPLDTTLLWRGYASAILFAEMDYDTDEPLDNDYSIYDFDKKSEADAKKMLSMYYSKNEEAIKESGLDLETIGMDIWYTQGGHGAGFFDHSLNQDVEDKLTQGANEFGMPSIETYNGKVIIRGISFDNYAKGGGIRRKNGQTYDYGRVWTKDHNEFDKGADHEVNYRR